MASDSLDRRSLPVFAPFSVLVRGLALHFSRDVATEELHKLCIDGFGTMTAQPKVAFLNFQTMPCAQPRLVTPRARHGADPAVTTCSPVTEFAFVISVWITIKQQY